MPTAGRLVYNGAICHIIQRGNNRQKIFREEDDYYKFLSIFRDYKIKYKFDIYNYCLMSNHLHFLIKIACGNEMSKLMQGVFQSFRFYYKKKYHYSGYLFQGRYKSKLIDKNGYLLECARYIERNPLRASIVDDLSLYKWTSYDFYANGRKDAIITENPAYATLGVDINEIQKAYKQYVLEDRLYERIIDDSFKIK